MLINPSLSFASCCVDSDGDTYSDHKTCRSGTDCDDDNWFIHPGTLGCNNCKDVDDDGYFAHDLRDCSLGDDLDDNDPEVNPGKGDGGGNGGGGGCSSVVWYKDYDDDKYSDGTTLTQCEQPPGYKPVSDLVQISGDCKDDPSVEPLAYKINPGAEEVCDDWEIDNNCDGTIDEGCCEGWIDASPPKEVRPQNTGGSVKANVIIGLNKPAPPKGCNVSLVVEPEKKSGGHEHDDDKRPKGTLSKNALLFPEGKTDTESPVYYTSFAISGTEKIKAEFKESKKSEKTAETSITVKVDGLQPLSLHEGYYRPTGSTPTHSSNHWGTLNTNSGVYRMATYLYYEYSIIVGINDMSLFWGGLFDICGTWNRKDTCSNAPEGGHLSHRKGTSADVDRIVQGGQYAGLGMARWTIDRACFRGGGKLADEPTYHCEFK